MREEFIITDIERSDMGHKITISPINKKILVRCDLSQKDFMQIGNVKIKRANDFDSNYRERSPVIAQVLEHTEELNTDDIILAHHNTFYPPSPYFLHDDLFSIPNNGKIIFAKIDSDGNAQAVCGNIIAEQIDIPTPYELPPEIRKKYKDRVKVLNDGYGYKKGQIVFTKPYTPYEIVYIWNDVEHRIIKINSEMIIGKLV